MTEDEFWNLVEESKKLAGDGGCYEQVRFLQSLLEQCHPADIEDFDKLYDEMRLESYDQRLWAAAYIINGGCSDDGFEYFRGWLISRGREVFERALRDPGSLALEISDTDDDLECEDMLYVARNAYEKKAGKEMPGRPPVEWKLKGEDWDEDTVDQLYPELAKAANARWE
ncbi:DUF4240 domain-containing protein [Verrucomicrobiota bacterium sgz303538]